MRDGVAARSTAARSPSMPEPIHHPRAFDGADRWKCTRRQRPSAASEAGSHRRQTRVSSVRVVACVEITSSRRVPVAHLAAMTGRAGSVER